METDIIKTIKLPNRLILNIHDISKKIAGDRWYLGVIIRIRILVEDALSGRNQNAGISIEEIESVVGKELCYEKKQERFFIAKNLKESELNKLIDSYLNSTLSYFSHPDFAYRYVMKTYLQKKKRTSWYI